MKTSSPAYNKMFEDGTAFKPIHISQPSPSMTEAGGSGDSPDNYIGEKLERDTTNQPDKPDKPEPDYSEFDSIMEQRVNNLRNGGGDSNNSGGTNTNEINDLKSRVNLLEQALSLVMEQQKPLIKKLNQIET